MREDPLMILVPRSEKDMKDPKAVMTRLKQGNSELGVTTDGIRMDDERGLIISVKVDGKPYEVVFYPTELEIPPFINLGHQFSKKETELLQKSSSGLAVTITYDEDHFQCYYDQLKIAYTMLPDMVAIMDCPSEKLLSGKWVKLAAQSKVKPSPRYLFTVQAVYTDEKEVWLHTHGMKRCGLYELEILCSTKEDYSNHYHIIESMAFRILESKEPINPGDPVFLAQVEPDTYMVATAVDWQEALKFYPDATLGTDSDRDDEWHREQTYVVMMYLNPQDEENKKYTRIQVFNKQLNQNPMFFYSHEETDRMRRLAQERIPYMKKELGGKDITILAKIGLQMDRDKWNSGNPETEKEHIWFEVQKVGDGELTAVLTQEPYNVSTAKEGEVMTLPFTDVTDWLILTPDNRISPDDVYLLEADERKKLFGIF